ncbi:N-acetyl-alpha-D-glucosaminyl L-malate synthase [bioreactor metagenome]|uniref:N-acetyl-alpha-D-glucosaminyl L-malate synthase n=1 Tax=bioreactor metagenome TaxID=1076179 RepID=A0A645BC09_9ZZZZ
MRRILIKHVDRFIAVSTSVKKTLLQNKFISEDKIAIIANGIDIEPYINKDISKNRNSSNQALIGIVGQVSPNKGQDVFLKSIPYVLEAFPQSKFIIVGSNYKHEAYSRQLNLLSQQLGIAGSVDFVGFSDDTIGVMQQLDIMALCSEKESFGLVVIEAMLCGTPVIVSDCGGIDDIVQDNVNGLIVPYGNPESLAKAITRILKDRTFSETIAKNAKKTVYEKFTLDKMVNKVIELYGGLSTDK